MEMELEDYLANVKDRETFCQFVEALVQDCSAAEAALQDSPDEYKWTDVKGWQNMTVSNYLDASLAWYKDSAHLEENSEPSWHKFAEILYGGKIYE